MVLEMLQRRYLAVATGQSLNEYGLVLGLVVILAIPGLILLGSQSTGGVDAVNANADQMRGMVNVLNNQTPGGQSLVNRPSLPTPLIDIGGLPVQFQLNTGSGLIEVGAVNGGSTSLNLNFSNNNNSSNNNATNTNTTSVEGLQQKLLDDIAKDSALLAKLGLGADLERVFSGTQFFREKAASNSSGGVDIGTNSSTAPAGVASTSGSGASNSSPAGVASTSESGASNSSPAGVASTSESGASNSSPADVASTSGSGASNSSPADVASTSGSGASNSSPADVAATSEPGASNISTVASSSMATFASTLGLNAPFNLEPANLNLSPLTETDRASFGAFFQLRQSTLAIMNNPTVRQAHPELVDRVRLNLQMTFFNQLLPNLTTNPPTLVTTVVGP